ncbi:membrane dipeptidase [Cohaesibacter sp. ES.047]|uniref:dipeptidase n=1 Tax=Cohaesibacter sp. ES.047 TaxID=1798205 RepID=UPI000BB73F0F|nr:dipeptidase [Cohaesibacter sp. ES.047]SNY93060.1 membrane dipeptidase [Cohaesibacter sp. ES.047]
MTDNAVPIFDGHNDTLLRLDMARRSNKTISFLKGDKSLHIDFPKAQAGALAGGLFAIFVPPPQEPGKPLEFSQMQQELDQGYALNQTLSMMAGAFRLARQSKARVQICRSSLEIKMAMEDGAVALMLHIEGAEAIDADFDALEVLYAAGLRSLGPVWSRSNIFGHGVPFNFPGSPDHGPGLTDAGKELVRECNKLGILIDLSHLNEQGFWDVNSVSTKPLVATHSNVHALCESPRNLTNDQLTAIAESKGLVGLNYAVGFLRSDGDKFNRDVSLDRMVDHIAYLLDYLGEDGVALGSDFDGAMVPNQINDVSGNQALIAQMRARDFGDDLIEKIAYRNWISMLEKTGI